MSRLNGVVLIADGQARQTINAIPGLSLEERDEGGGLHLLYERDGERIDIIVSTMRQNITVPGRISNAPSGRWDAFMLYADGRDIDPQGYRWLGRAWRYLHRRQQAQPGWVLGPFSIEHVIAQWPAAGAALLTDGSGNWSFPILFGDHHDAVAAVDYRPTQDEIDNDTEVAAP